MFFRPYYFLLLLSTILSTLCWLFYKRFFRYMGAGVRGPVQQELSHQDYFLHDSRAILGVGKAATNKPATVTKCLEV